jgi:hypothetical protein
MTETFEQELEKNITKAVAKFKREGTCGMSLQCLMQNTPTPKASHERPSTPRQYEEMFSRVANKKAKAFITGQS